MRGLIIDDSRVMRQVARQILEKLTYTVEEASDCDGAMACCLRAMPDVVLVDLNMPGANATAFVRTLRRQGDAGKPRIIVLSTENDAALLTDAVQAGADDYLLKPFDTETITAALKGSVLASGN
ncbi:MAG: response regulator [Rhizomicrobium sp.]